MPRSHWLDPLARRVLKATGQLPSAPATAKACAAPAWTLDVNRATDDQWRQLAGCTEEMADLLIRLQRGGVQFSNADELFRLLGLPADLARLWQPHLIFNWYGDAPPQPLAAPLDLNLAETVELQELHQEEMVHHHLLLDHLLLMLVEVVDLCITEEVVMEDLVAAVLEEVPVD